MKRAGQKGRAYSELVVVSVVGTTWGRENQIGLGWVWVRKLVNDASRLQVWGKSRCLVWKAGKRWEKRGMLGE